MRPNLEGANCQGLPGFVIDKYFYCHTRHEPLKAMVALAICGRCEVREACRDAAFNGTQVQQTGIIGGVTATEIRAARAWHAYELGLLDKPPRWERPLWVPMTDASMRMEETRIAIDPDEQDANDD